MSKWFVVLIALGTNHALANTDLTRAGHTQKDVSLERYAGDLVGQDPHDRLFAARVIRTRVREAWRWAGGATDQLRAIEARQMLSTFDVLVAPRCTRQLSVANLLRPCAQILGMLEFEAALPALLEARQSAHLQRDKRTLDAAINRIRSAQ